MLDTDCAIQMSDFVCFDLIVKQDLGYHSRIFNLVLTQIFGGAIILEPYRNVAMQPFILGLFTVQMKEIAHSA